MLDKFKLFIQFRLTHLIAGFTLLCFVFAFISWQCQTARYFWKREQAALSELPSPEHGYIVTRDLPVYYPLLRPWCRAEYFDRVSEFSLEYEYDSIDAEEQMAALTMLTRLRSLKFVEPIASDDNVRRLASLQHLESLDLSGCEISANSLGFVSQLPSLKKVDVSYTNVGDKGVRQLITFSPRLEELRIGDVQLSEETVVAISKMENLVELDLSGTSTPVKTLEHLGKSASLRRLYIYRTPLSEHDLSNLATKLNFAITY
ncbi:hypothetical protein DTL42_17235 [Bremerella cremea]|uniref:F-box/LRR-repeat protein 15/At3g58940/PEG3-like LRR domain-containing protein n=1 Tax=Bremerella cremea TaxID=1031537 RepID=A0A368KN82_9BACT|nr:hypothetical protein [Bremerella cremea]RCS44666.1 hypothetical protein DTL42_17235 [Bremerella cremea]